MPVIKAILFDLDGTTFHSWPGILYCLRIIEHKYIGHSSNRCEKAYDQISAGTEAMLKVTLGTTSVDPQIVAEINKMYMNLSHAETKSCLFDGVEDFLDALNLKKMPWGIVTNKPKSMTLSLLSAFPKLKPPSGCVICPEDVNGKKKPDPSSILKACSVLNISPSECVYVGDSIDDITAGNLAGVVTVGALFGYVPKNQNPERDWRANFCIRRISDLDKVLAKLAATTKNTTSRAYIRLNNIVHAIMPQESQAFVAEQNNDVGKRNTLS